MFLTIIELSAYVVMYRGGRFYRCFITVKITIKVTTPKKHVLGHGKYNVAINILSYDIRISSCLILGRGNGCGRGS